MSNYPRPPPSYSSSKPAYGSTEDHREPLLGDRRSPEPGSSAGGIYNQPRYGDVPDDFKVSVEANLPIFLLVSLLGVQYGVSVSESSLEIRNAFVRKVYSILCMSRPSGKRSRLTITNPLSPFTSRTNREYHIYCILQP